jgi:transcriptional regulator with XRE-family HTH domain
LLSKEEQTRFNKIVGKLIREARENSKIKQEVLSSFLGFKSRISIANIEAGKQNIPLTTLVEIADYLKIPISSLIPPVEAIKIQVADQLVKNIEKEGIEDPKLSERLSDLIRYAATKK